MSIMPGGTSIGLYMCHAPFNGTPFLHRFVNECTHSTLLYTQWPPIFTFSSKSFLLNHQIVKKKFTNCKKPKFTKLCSNCPNFVQFTQWPPFCKKIVTVDPSMAHRHFCNISGCPRGIIGKFKGKTLFVIQVMSLQRYSGPFSNVYLRNIFDNVFV